MSDEELLMRYYRHRTNASGRYMCPLYIEGVAANEQRCAFYIEPRNDNLDVNESHEFWSHVRSTHPLEFDQTLRQCRDRSSKTTVKSKTVDEIFDMIGAASGKLQKLVFSYGVNDLSSNEFMTAFQAQLNALNEQVAATVNLTAPAPTTAPTSLATI